VIEELVMRGQLLRLCIVALSIASCIVVYRSFSAASQRGAEELGARYAAKYLELPSFIQDSRFWYYGLGQGRSVYGRLEIPNEYVAQFLSINCFDNMTKLSSDSNPFKGHVSGGVGVPPWWTPQEAPAAVGGSCSKGGEEFDISIVPGRERATVYLFLMPF
jgi:hypothetical protein